VKLEGSLDAFSLPDIFQLLSYTKKTGGLRLQRAGAHGVVYFTDGAVTGAAADGGRQALARRLVGRELVDHDALAAAVAAAVKAGTTSGGGGVVAELVAAGAIDAETVLPVADAQVHDAVFELLRWPGGDFALAVDDPNPDDVGLRLQPDEVVTRATEQQERWDAAAALVPSPESIPTLAGTADADTTVAAEDWVVLRLVDGRRRVSEIVDLLGAGQLSTVVTLADLVERGILAIGSGQAVDPVSDTVRTLALLAPAEDVDALPGRTVAAVTDDDPSEDVATAPVVVAEPTPEPTPEPAPAPPSKPRAAKATRPVVAAPAAVTAAVVEALSTPAPEATRTPAAQPAAAAAVLDPTPAAVADDAVDADEADDGAAAQVAERPEGDLSAAPAPGPTASAPRLGGAHQPGDVVPPRAEPFIAARQPDFAESPGPHLRSAPSAAPRAGALSGGAGASTAATAQNLDSMIERDPSVNRSLLLRLIAGVRGL
jgi:hypothetical protein